MLHSETFKKKIRERYIPGMNSRDSFIFKDFKKYQNYWPKSYIYSLSSVTPTKIVSWKKTAKHLKFNQMLHLSSQVWFLCFASRMFHWAVKCPLLHLYQKDGKENLNSLGLDYSVCMCCLTTEPCELVYYLSKYSLKGTGFSGPLVEHHLGPL